MSRFTSSSTAAISSSLSALPWVKSKRSRWSLTSEPFWLA